MEVSIYLFCTHVQSMYMYNTALASLATPPRMSRSERQMLEGQVAMVLQIADEENMTTTATGTLVDAMNTSDDELSSDSRPSRKREGIIIEIISFSPTK